MKFWNNVRNLMVCVCVSYFVLKTFSVKSALSCEVFEKTSKIVLGPKF